MSLFNHSFFFFIRSCICIVRNATSPNPPRSLSMYFILVFIFNNLACRINHLTFWMVVPPHGMQSECYLNVTNDMNGRRATSSSSSKKNTTVSSMCVLFAFAKRTTHKSEPEIYTSGEIVVHNANYTVNGLHTMCPISQIYIYRWDSFCNVRNDIDNWSYFIWDCVAVSIAFGSSAVRMDECDDGYATWLRRRKIIVRFGNEKWCTKYGFSQRDILLRLHLLNKRCLSSVKCSVAVLLNIFFSLFLFLLLLLLGHFTFLFAMVECNLSVLGTDFSRDLWYLKCVDTFSMNFR